MLLAHLDFKGVLPREEYVPQLLQDLATLGYDGVLVEYEDVFPFESFSVAVDEKAVWSAERLQNFLGLAARLNLQVVPLQQTLGHLEYVLRWNDLRELALDQSYPSTLDVTRIEAREMVKAMLGEVLEVHPDSRYIHLGMDEAVALVSYAKANELDVVTLFLDYLETLCDECERYNVKPVIWSDMIEDNFSSSSLQRFRAFSHRVVLCSWDYEADGARTASARINGNRVAKFWRDNPTAEGAPDISASTLFVEDLDENAREFIAPYFDGKTFAPLFWCDAWRSLGFEVWGASASRTSGDGAVLPHFHKHEKNVQAWSQALKRSDASTQVVTSWARGTTFCPPIYPFEATWFSLEAAAKSEGKLPIENAPQFFSGVEPQTVARIFHALGKTRENWRLEIPLAEEMEALLPQLTSHHYEWQATAILARVLAWQRRLNFAREEVVYFECNDWLPQGEWQRRLDEQNAIEADGVALRDAASRHFLQRYEGGALEEWLRDVFDVPLDLMRNDAHACGNKLEKSLLRYAR